MRLLLARKGGPISTEQAKRGLNPHDLEGVCVTKVSGALHYHPGGATAETKRYYLNNQWSLSEGWCQKKGRLLSGAPHVDWQYD